VELILWENIEMMADRHGKTLVKKNKTVRQAVRQALRQGLLWGSTSVAVVGSLAFNGQALAQDQDPDSLIDEAQLLEEVIVTGSRLSRSGFESSAPMDIVNVQEGIGLGYADLNEMLTSTPALMGTDQMTDVMSGILSNVNGGQGVQTINLRGLGAGRTLSLINGRRAGPAGVRDGVTSFDVNVIPVSGLERVEILKDGASSIYGSDAIGGVVNFITRKGTGGEVNAYTQRSEETGGEIYQINASYGRESDKGYWRVTADYNKQEQILKGDRDIFECEQEYIFNEPELKTRADVIDPRTGEYKCYSDPGDAGSVWIYDYHYYTYYAYALGEVSNVHPTNTRAVYDYDGFIAASGLLPDRNNGANDPADLRVPEGWYILPQGALGESLRPTGGDFADQEVMVPERERFTIMASGEYNVNDSMTLYAEGLFNRRETHHESITDFWSYNYTSNWGINIQDPDNICIECWSDNYDYYYVDIGAGDPDSVGWTGAQFLDPIIAYPSGAAKTTVDYTRVVVGAIGDIGSSDWSYDAAFQYSKSDGEYVDNLVFDDARYASTNRIPYWAGDHVGRCEGTTFDRLGPDGEIRQADIPCLDINFLDPRVLLGNLTDEEKAFLYGTETGTTKYTNMSLDVGFANNDLFSMPAGEFGLAVGLQYMTDEIADTPGIESRSGNNWDGTWGPGSAKVFGTYGETATSAAYVEARIPLLAGKKGFEYVELNVSARYTNVSIDETEDSDARDFDDTTYKIGLDWRINENFRFRANRGTSFRTPALFELYRKNFHRFPSQSANDPCYRWAANLDSNQITQRVADNCAADGVPDNIHSTIPMDNVTGGGAAHLDPETSVSNTIGVVFTASESDFRLSVDYFHLEVEDRIGTFSAETILDGCYESDTFPDDQFCGLFKRDDSGNMIEGWRVESVQSSYINLDISRVAGWDIEADYHISLPREYDLSIRTAHTISTTKETENKGGTVTSTKGRAGSPEWVGNLTFALNKGPWRGSWRITYIDSTDNNREGIATSGTWIGFSGEEETFYYSYKLDSRIYHNASLNYKFGKGWAANLSVTNITDETSPRATQGAGIRIQGYGAFHSQYDWKGRRYGLNIKKVF
jgi:iron complex outermembrane receptor protein